MNPLLRVFRVFPLMVPLVLIALRRAGTIALALDLRAFGARPDRTFFVDVQSMRTKLEAGGKVPFFFPSMTFAISGLSTSQPN